MKEITPLNIAFTAVIDIHDNSWTCVRWPESVTFFGSTKPAKVKGTMNGVAFQATFLPTGNGAQFLPVRKTLLNAMDAKIGDTVKVHLAEWL